jgi:hypothetical protein
MDGWMDGWMNHIINDKTDDPFYIRPGKAVGASGTWIRKLKYKAT